MNDWIEGVGPATIANLTCGFDIIGLALQYPFDKVKVRKNNSGRIKLLEIRGNDELSKDINKNTATIAVMEMLKHIDSTQGIDMVLEKNLPLGSGLGSSAASAAAALKGVNQLLGYPLKNEELVDFALKSEKAACGTAHADNAAPAILGGIIMIQSYHPLNLIPLPVTPDWNLLVIHPRVEVKTSEARKILPSQVPLTQMTEYTANFGTFIQGVLTGNNQLIKKSNHDNIIEAVRKENIPYYREIIETLNANQSIASGISGSGPSIYSIFEDKNQARKAGDELTSKLNKKIELDLYLTKIMELSQGSI